MSDKDEYLLAIALCALAPKLAAAIVRGLRDGPPVADEDRLKPEGDPPGVVLALNQIWPLFEAEVIATVRELRELKP